MESTFSNVVLLVALGFLIAALAAALWRVRDG